MCGKYTYTQIDIDELRQRIDKLDAEKALMIKNTCEIFTNQKTLAEELIESISELESATVTAVEIIKDRKSWEGIKGNESLEGLCDFLVREIEKPYCQEQTQGEADGKD